jgi:hypothetical protein
MTSSGSLSPPAVLAGALVWSEQGQLWGKGVKRERGGRGRDDGRQVLVRATAGGTQLDFARTGRPPSSRKW